MRHRRFEPVRHDFRHALFLTYVDLAELPELFRGRWLWSYERRNCASFFRRDHFGDPAQPLDEAVRETVHRETGTSPRGPIRLLTHLRYFGYCFNPLSVYFCFDPAGERVETLLAEVTNTPWHERHCYVLPLNGAEPGRSVVTCEFPKRFHVSPFMTMDYDYRWRVEGPGPTLSIHAENLREGDVRFDATLTLRRRPWSPRELARALLRYPLMTAQVTTAIHWQALRLWLRGVPYVPHPRTLTSPPS